MKRKIHFLSLLLIIVTICLTCKKDDEWYHITAYEEQLHKCVNEFRKSQGKSDLVLQFVMVVEAQKHSKEWKDSGDPVTGLQEHFEVVIEKIGGTNSGAITSKVYNLLPDSVVNLWIADSSTRDILLDVYTQSGPGIAEGENGAMYITHMFLNIPSKP
jgi:uncharacterized protein YkwD